MKTLLVVLAYLFLFIYQSSATPQIPDELTLNFEKIDVQGFMVDDLIKQQIKLTKNKHCSDYSLTSSANHRGFIAILYVKNGKLFLRDLQIRVYSEESDRAFEELKKIATNGLKKGEEARVEKLYDAMRKGGRISVPLGFLKNKGHADWFSGDLYHYYGKPLSYRYTHRLSQARVLSFSKGNLVSDKNISVKE